MAASFLLHREMSHPTPQVRQMYHPVIPQKKKLPPYPGGPFNNHNAAPFPPGMTIDNVGFL